MILHTDSVYFFTLNEPYHKCTALYDGSIPVAVLTAESGKRVQIPAGQLRRFIDSRGLAGRFRLVVSKDNKIKNFERIY